MSDTPLFENEKKLLETKLIPPEMITIDPNGVNIGKLIITDQRIICHFPKLGTLYGMLHNMITSFKWDSGFMKGSNFKITWFENQQSLQIHQHTNNKKKIVKILEKMPYYDQPAVLKYWSGDIQETDRTIPNDLVTILKIRYAKGEISKEEFEKMKKDLK